MNRHPFNPRRSIASPPVWRTMPHPEEPGCLADQLAAIALYLANPWNDPDRDRRWQMARRTCIQHARRAAL